MSSVSDAVALERFRAAIARRLGLHFEDAKLGFLAEVLQRRLEASGHSAEQYLERIEGGVPLREELRILAPELTIGETYFFRHQEQFRAFSEVALPERLSANSTQGQIGLLSAGCASGEEPYSLGILLHEHGLEPRWRVSLRGVDVNPAALARAACARYSEWSLRETPAAIRQRWFSCAGREWTLAPAIRASVAFEERNLASDDPELWPPASYDVVFCRNVLMYFTTEAAQQMVARISRALAPGGYLFLGHAETLRGLSNDFALRHTHNTFYYQRKAGERSELATPPLADACSRTEPVPIAALGWETSWLESVQRAADRIQALSERPLRPQAADCAEAPVDAADMGLAFELLRQERFAEALSSLREPAPGSEPDVDLQLLRAVLLAHTGEIVAAESACTCLLDLDELNAGAHYVLALCRESRGDRKGAVDHDQAAIYLDRSFAMPHLHLGLMARRAGDRDTAVRDLAQAVLMLQREDPSRILLFGGGFRREALIALCQAELAAAQGAA